MTTTNRPLVAETTSRIIRLMFHRMKKQSNAAQQTRKAAGLEKANIKMFLLMVFKPHVINMDGF